MAGGLQGRRAAVIGLDAAIAEMIRATLREICGLDAFTLRDQPSLVETLASGAPDLLVVDIGQSGKLLPLLDALRSHPVTKTVPVIVLGLWEPARLQALASGNVRYVLDEPFDIADLERAVELALQHPAFETTVRQHAAEQDAALAATADWLNQRERPLMLDWVQRVRANFPYSARPDLTERDVLDTMPRLVLMLAEALRYQSGSAALRADADSLRGVQQHVTTRRQQGVPADNTVSEFMLLRQVLLEQVHRDFPCEVAFRVFSKLNLLVDEISRMAVAELLRQYGAEPRLPGGEETPPAPGA